MIRKFIRLQDHLRIHDRGDDRAAPNNGHAVYVNNDEVRSVDTNGTVHKHLTVTGDTTTTAVSPGFGSWTEADPDRPADVEVAVTVETDGSSAGEVVVDVDEDGGTSADYSIPVAYVDPDNAGGTQDKDAQTVYVPAGAQYQVRNVSDPNSNNSITAARQITK